jgi:hypothetical protein
VTIALELRHLWTATGEPVAWTFHNANEHELRDLLGRLDDHRADPETRAAVLLATIDDDTLLGAWNRDGAAELRDSIKMIARAYPLWLEVAAALDDGVTGP